MSKAALRASVVSALLLAAASSLAARIVRVEVERREPVLESKLFGLAGPYEKIVGRAYFAVDPENPANRIITDIDRAPRNAKGEVEFSADLYLIKPQDLDRSSGTLVCEINNRGRKGMLSMFNRADGSLDPSSAEHFGDGWLMEQGHTLLWVGWQFDPPRDEHKMFLYPPSATGPDGEPIRGLVRSDFVVTDRVSEHTLADRDHAPYPVADPDAEENVMTVRDSVEGERRTIPRSKWRFARMEEGEPTSDTGSVWLEGGFEPGKIYEVVYVSENPPLVGLGAAAVRDFVSYLKNESNEEIGFDEQDYDRAIGFGTSQSGRFLRTFLYYGFNQNEDDERAFDGVMSHVAGGGRGSFNHRFAQPSRDAHPFMNFLYPTDIFPFTDVEQTDPDLKRTDSILGRYEDRPDLIPKIFYTNSSYEYWGRAASLIHTSIDGTKDVEIPESTRIYHFAGTQHGPAGFPPRRSIGQQLSNPMDFRWAMRALLAAMDDWIALGEEPPPSRYGKIADDTLVSAEELSFPDIPGVNFSTRLHKAYKVDYGPRFYSEGIVDREPPKILGAYPMLVPAVDEDGNEIAGIRLPEQQVPLATYAGWNLFNAKSGPTDEISSMQGSYIPLPRTREERLSSGDPRLSIEERYGGRTDYLGRIAEAVVDLTKKRYLLDGDAPEIIRAAERHWQHLAVEAAPTH